MAAYSRSIPVDGFDNTEVSVEATSALVYLAQGGNRDVQYTVDEALALHRALGRAIDAAEANEN